MLVSQNNSCAICLIHHSAFSKALHVDHNHRTGKVRALLCQSCNHLIGHSKEKIETLGAAIKYLEQHQ
jgi:hypothetical protein